MAKSQIEIGLALRDYLLTKERTQRDLAEKIGISTAHLSNYLRGAERISRNVAERIVEIWPEIRIAFLLSGDGDLLAPRVAAARPDELASLREQLAQKTAENARLLGIIEKLTDKCA